MIARYRKAFAALVGAATPAAVVFVLGLAGVHVDAALAGAICTILAGAVTAWAPANAPKPSPVAPVPTGTTTTTTGGTAP